tara:strand:+ start:5700 stop:6110 length:411 start_codon:yes stop_codon:yes gene_type:complete
MGPWWLYVLVFVFGYLTHKTFYFLRSVKVSIGLIRVAQLISLAILAKSMENFYNSHTARLRNMKEREESEKDIRDTRRSFNQEISMYKENAIKQIIDLHPSFYTPIVDFNNWKSAMKHLDDNKEFVLSLLSQDKND